jgi:hypothetical protein
MSQWISCILEVISEEDLVTHIIRIAFVAVLAVTVTIMPAAAAQNVGQLDSTELLFNSTGGRK